MKIYDFMRKCDFIKNCDFIRNYDFTKVYDFIKIYKLTRIYDLVKNLKSKQGKFSINFILFLQKPKKSSTSGWNIN